MTHASNAMLADRNIRYEENGDILFEASPEQVVKPAVKPAAKYLLAIGKKKPNEPFVVVVEPPFDELTFMAHRLGLLRDDKETIQTPMSDDTHDEIDNERIGEDFSAAPYNY